MTCLHELDNRHLGIITLTIYGPQNTGVSSTAVAITISSSLKQRVNKLLVIHPRHGLTTGVQITTLPKFDHVVDMLSYCSGSDQSGLDTSVPNDLCSKSAEEGLSLIGGLAQLLESLSMRNHAKSRASHSRSMVKGRQRSSDEGATASNCKRSKGITLTQQKDSECQLYSHVHSNKHADAKRSLGCFTLPKRRLEVATMTPHHN